MATTIEGDAIYIGTAEYVDINLAGTTINSNGYASVDLTNYIPSGYIAYAITWANTDWDYNIILQLGGSSRITLKGTPNYTMVQGYSKVRVFYRKFATPTS